MTWLAGPSDLVAVGAAAAAVGALAVVGLGALVGGGAGAAGEHAASARPEVPVANRLTRRKLRRFTPNSLPNQNCIQFSNRTDDSCQ